MTQLHRAHSNSHALRTIARHDISKARAPTAIGSLLAVGILLPSERSYQFLNAPSVIHEAAYTADIFLRGLVNGAQGPKPFLTFSARLRACPQRSRRVGP